MLPSLELQEYGSIMAEKKHIYDGIGLALGRIALQIAFVFLGLRVLSVDDYLRTWVSAEIAVQWKWFPDPIFLPAHFWIYALPLKLGLPIQAGSIGLTILLAGLSSFLMYQIFLTCRVDRKVAWIGTILWSVQPLGIWLGGVPLSETLSLFLILLALFGWCQSQIVFTYLGAISLAAVSLVRYEVWPLALFFSGSIWFWNRGTWIQKSIQSSLSLLGLAVFLLWRYSTTNPFGPLQFAKEVASRHHDPFVVGGKILWAGLYMVPLLFPALLYILVHGQKALRGNWDHLPFRWLTIAAVSSLLPLITPFFAIGYFGLTFPERILFVPAALLIPMAVIGANRFLYRFHVPIVCLFTGASSVLFLWIAGNPPVAVKPETLQAAAVIEQFLTDRPEKEKILVERKDLGWTVLWGLNDGDARLLFDRPDLRSVSPWTNPDRARKIFSQYHTASCVLNASHQGHETARRVLPDAWTLEWTSGKYRLLCKKPLRSPEKL